MVRRPGIAVDPHRVRQARLEHGLSLAQVAGGDVSRAFIHQVETGQSKPSRIVLALIARRTHKPISFFTIARESETIQAFDIPAELSRSADDLKHYVGYASLTGPEQEAIELLYLSLRQGAKLVRSINAKQRRSLAS